MPTHGSHESLNVVRARPDHSAQPSVQAAIKRYLAHVAAVVEGLLQLAGPT